MNTLYHAKLFAHELSLMQSGGSVDRLSRAMFDACIDLNPHQINAALFALKNPLSKGSILADEVGLGKTIETGLVLSQLWAEGKRSFLIIAPKSLRHQWKDELENLFFLKSEILSGQDFKKLNTSERHPFGRGGKIIITNEHSVDSHNELIGREHWDLVVIDEAHKLRNVWKQAKSAAKRAKRIKKTLEGTKKLLLTATPLQNSLMELYGLTSFIDDYALGSRESFQSLFCNVSESEREIALDELRKRMEGFFHRELRKNVLEYINYTNRNTITFTYDPTDYEEDLRIKFEEFLRKEVLISVPASALPLLKLVYLKLIASSTFAIKNSLINLYKRLTLLSVSIRNRDLFNELYNNIQKELTLENGVKSIELESFEKALFSGVIEKNYDGLVKNHIALNPVDELSNEEIEVKDNYSDQELEEALDNNEIELFDEASIRSEADEILKMASISLKINQNKKADALLDALRQQFKKARNEGWPEKAVIFTEFRSTQEYILKKLKELGLDIEKEVVIFNGDSGDAENRRLLVKQFKENKKIFLTTEAGAEGLNLQFCNLLINYDLPWNPQRIEQRIGRCHRYGQKLDVIVVNFVNTKNVADTRVLELLQEKFSLFKGAFGASDEVLGSIEEGHDVEKDILNIYLSCRTEAEIDAAFKDLQKTSSDKISDKMQQTKDMVLKNFDEDVHSKLKMQLDDAEKRVDNISKMFWSLTKNILVDRADFDDDSLAFNLRIAPSPQFEEGKYLLGEYRMISKSSQDEDTYDRIYRLSHPLGEFAINKAKEISSPLKNLTFDLSKYPLKISSLEKYIGKSGYLEVSKLRIESFGQSEQLIYSCIDEEGGKISQEVAKKIFNLEATIDHNDVNLDSSGFEEVFEYRSELISSCLMTAEQENKVLFEKEAEKLDKWADDLAISAEKSLEEIKKKIKDLKKKARSITEIKEKQDLQKQIRELERKQRLQRQTIFEEEDRIAQLRDDLILKLEKEMSQSSQVEEILKIKWTIQ